MKLMLTSFETSPEQDVVLAELAGKPLQGLRVAYIENAHDPYVDEASQASLLEGRESLRRKGFDLEVVDLRDWTEDRAGLRATLAGKDIFLFAGGNPFYLRWLLKTSGADEIIPDLMRQGAVYCGASAGGVVAGPTLRYFDNQDDPAAAGEVIWEGLGVTRTVLVPHIDNPDFGAGCREAGEKLRAEGFHTQWITDAQALVIDGDREWII